LSIARISWKQANDSEDNAQHQNCDSYKKGKFSSAIPFHQRFRPTRNIEKEIFNCLWNSKQNL